MRTGNVIRPPDSTSLWIVTDVGSTMVHAVSFTNENCSAVQDLDDHDMRVTCSCVYLSDEDAEECSCGGTGEYVNRIKGWKHSTILASTVRDFIMQGFLNVGMTMGLPR